ncbi:hypothetical protein JZ751_007567 [Albula glossodonta]|uniref:Anti-proliferative protein domain-containing protein n=1 Tax=Albula glossodonta TaxID=121402 RepID=A0A8T2N330_9TELE|nr:hypothetical protein JZ751_007567 [Albula glossodonta]
MGPEVTAAAGFVSSLLRTRGFLSEQQLQIFCDCLQQALSEKPQKGSGYRCIRINHEMDPIISRAASRIGLNSYQLYQLLPRELTLWVDPYEVSYRIGEDGSICVLYEAEAPAASAAPASGSHTAYSSALHCKNHFLMGRTSPPKNYLMTVSS